MKPQQQQLLDLYAGLDEQARATLLAFAEFLASQGDVAPVVAGKPPARQAAQVPTQVPEPEAIERPEGESVVAALKRLSKTYPMLDKSEMLGATSDMVATHIMQGTEPVLVIDQLEETFAEHYRQLQERAGG